MLIRRRINLPQLARAMKGGACYSARLLPSWFLAPIGGWKPGKFSRAFGMMTIANTVNIGLSGENVNRLRVAAGLPVRALNKAEQPATAEAA